MSNESNDIAPFFSIIVPSYNSASSLGRTLSSCFAQSLASFELVIVDDGSTDDTETVVKRYEDPRIVYISQANAGASAARNRGAEAARGQYLAFLDSDDEFLPGKLQAFHKAILATGKMNANIVWYSPLYFYRGEGNRVRKPDRAIAPDERVGDYLFAYDGMMQTSTLVMAKSLFAQIGFNNELKNLEDLDLCLRLEAAGARFRMLPEPYVIWYDDASEGRLSYTTTIDNVLAWAAMERGLLSNKAYYGFLARYSVPIVIRKEPVKAMYLLAAAVRHGSVSTTRALSLLLRGAAPGAYGRLRDALVTLRGA